MNKNKPKVSDGTPTNTSDVGKQHSLSSNTEGKVV